MIARLPEIVLAAVILAWFIFAAAFYFQRRPAAATAPPADRKREPASILGLVLQGLSYGLVWTVRRPLFTLPLRFSPAAAVGWAGVTILVAIASVWFTVAAVRTLGQEWSLTARLVEGHRLVRTGPYRWVRHPIYTGMLGMLIATGLAISHWMILLAALALFLLGTWIRVRFEERLLREAFGAEFEEYARRVPAIIPFAL